MAIPAALEVSIREFQDYVDDLRRSNFLTFSDALSRLMSLFGASTELSAATIRLGQVPGFADWFLELNESIGGMGGRGQLNWPRNTNERLAVQLELLKRLDDNRIDFPRFCTTYLTTSGKYDDMVHAFSEHVVRQFARDFVRFIHTLGENGVTAVAVRQWPPVTKLPTRDQLQDSLSRRLRSGCSVSVVFIDLDNFKALNDSKGHDAGNVCLEDVSRVVSAAIDLKGELFRYGGDEFAVILPNFDESEGMVTAGRILTAIRTAGRSVGVTASIGVATSAEGVGADELINRADRAMYSSKHSTKDRVTSWSSAIDKDAPVSRAPQMLDLAANQPIIGVPERNS